MANITTKEASITEDWLRSVGFKWHEELQYSTERAAAPAKVSVPRKHWLLWLGGVANIEPDGKRRMFCCDEDLGLELCQGQADASARFGAAKNYSRAWWYCWLRADTSHRYSRFLHIRHIRTQGELIMLVVALSGHAWQPENHLYGKIFTQKHADQIRERDERLDIVIAKGTPWYESEKDDSSGASDISDLRINREKEGHI